MSLVSSNEKNSRDTPWNIHRVTPPTREERGEREEEMFSREKIRNSNFLIFLLKASKEI